MVALCIATAPASYQNEIPIAGTASVLIDYMNEPAAVEEEVIEPVKAIEYQSKDVPTHNAFKSYMDADCISSRASAQYQLKSQYELSDNGIWTVEGRYCIAVGSYYCIDIGTKIDLVMQSGETVECILADCKADRDTDCLNRQNPNGSIVEFIVRTSSLERQAKRMGDCSYADSRLFGEIKEIRIYED